MAKKKSKKEIKKKKSGIKKKRVHKKNDVKEYIIEVSKMKGDTKTFIDKFKSDVEKKREGYRLYTRKFRKKNPNK